MHDEHNQPPRAGLYTRVSTDDQAREGFSLEDQKRRGREVARREKWEATVYPEPGRSGADRDRPELARLLRDVEAGLLDVVWFDTQDRLARDVGHTADLIAEFIAADIAVWEGSSPIDLSDDGQAQVDLKALFAAWERRKIKARTRKGIAAHARTSGKPWGQPGYGWRKRADGHWELSPGEAPVARRIFDRYFETAAFNAVAVTLNAEGIPSQHGSVWTPGMIGHVIKRRYVLGEFRREGEWRRGEYPDGTPYPAIVDEAIWERAQTLGEPSQKWTPKGGGRIPARHLFIRGSLRCGCGCGSAMLPRTDSRRKTRRETYESAAHKRDPSTCSTPILERAAVEIPMLEMFEHEAFDYEATRGHVAGQIDRRIADATAQVQRAEREMIQKCAALDRFDREHEAGDLGAANYERQVERVTKELAALEAQAQQYATHLAASERERGNLDAESETLRRLAALREAIAGKVRDAGRDVGALRAALAQVFAGFWVAADPLRPGEYGVLPEPRLEMVNRAEGMELPAERLQRVPITLGDNQHETLVS